MARKVPSINTGAMADISFLLLTFFLLTSSITNEQGIPRLLPKPSTEQQKQEEDIRQRNIMTILVNRNNDVLVTAKGEQYVIEKKKIATELKDKAKEFLANPKNDPNLPEKFVKQIDNLGAYEVSRGVISLTNDNNTTFETYILVQNELQKAVNELRDEAALNYFGQKMDKLDPEEKKAIQEAIPINISEASSAN
ncbi:MAG: biopolymer transporter ExbD [Bacteroidales bacterium]|nr:biopolymer transporter ExbD [Bacteroidales bacterium]